jgi:hypothetical protein
MEVGTSAVRIFERSKRRPSDILGGRYVTFRQADKAQR